MLAAVTEGDAMRTKNAVAGLLVLAAGVAWLVSLPRHSEAG